MSEPTLQSLHPKVTAQLRAAGCVFAEDEATIYINEATSPAELQMMVERRCTGVPLEHIVGWAEFCGHRIAVGSGVFVPRHRTEFLVNQAIKRTRPGFTVVDLCCGSGALGLAVASSVGGIKLYACDIEPEAITFARRNLAGIGQVFEGDLFEPLPSSLKGSVDILLANVPYVPTGDIRLMPSEARLFEPNVTLDGGHDGLDVLRRVAPEAPQWLAPGGQLFTECSSDQAAAAADILGRHGLAARVATSRRHNATVVIATKASFNS